MFGGMKIICMILLRYEIFKKSLLGYEIFLHKQSVTFILFYFIFKMSTRHTFCNTLVRFQG